MHACVSSEHGVHRVRYTIVYLSLSLERCTVSQTCKVQSINLNIKSDSGHETLSCLTCPVARRGLPLPLHFLECVGRVLQPFRA